MEQKKLTDNEKSKEMRTMLMQQNSLVEILFPFFSLDIIVIAVSSQLSLSQFGQ